MSAADRLATRHQPLATPLMNSYFFRVEHDLLRSEAFKTLGGSAIKVYLVIGLYSDFGTDWAYPSIRTIARQAGLSRQTVLAAIEQLTRMGLLAASKSKGRSTAYRIIRQAPERPTKSKSTAAGQRAENRQGYRSKDFRGTPPTVPESLEVSPRSGPRSWTGRGPAVRPARPGEAGPNENQHRKKTRQHRSRSRERRSGSRPRAGSLLLWICKNC